MTTRRLAGLALAGYALLTLVAFIASGVPGGDYEPDKVAAFLAGDQATGIVLSWAALAAGFALLTVGRHAREALGGPAGERAHDLGVVATSAATVGAFVHGGLLIALTEGGAGMAAGVPQPVAYTLGEMSNLLAVCAPAFALGALGLVLARHYPMPVWLRVATVIGALGGLTAPLFLTYFVFLLWALLLGAWWSLRPARDAVSAAIEPATSIG